MKIVIVWMLRLLKKIINAKPAINDLVKQSDNGLITNDNADVCSENADSFLLEEDNKYNLTETEALESAILLQNNISKKCTFVHFYLPYFIIFLIFTGRFIW